jgi:hypothetical protein
VFGRAGSVVSPLPWTRGVGVLLTVDLANPSKMPLVEGQIELQWLGPDGKPLDFSSTPRPPFDCSNARQRIMDLEDQINGLGDLADTLVGAEKGKLHAQIAELVREVEILRRGCPRTEPPKEPANPGEISDAESVMQNMSPAQRDIYIASYYKSLAPPGPEEVPLSAGESVILAEARFQPPPAVPSSLVIENIPNYIGTRLIYAVCQVYMKTSQIPVPSVCRPWLGSGR